MVFLALKALQKRKQQHLMGENVYALLATLPSQSCLTAQSCCAAAAAGLCLTLIDDTLGFHLLDKHKHSGIGSLLSMFAFALI